MRKHQQSGKAVQFYGELFSLLNAKPFFKSDRGLCAQDEGVPGARGGKFYGAYFRDLDGNKLAIFCMTAWCLI